MWNELDQDLGNLDTFLQRLCDTFMPELQQFVNWFVNWWTENPFATILKTDHWVWVNSLNIQSFPGRMGRFGLADGLIKMLLTSCWPLWSTSVIGRTTAGGEKTTRSPKPVRRVSLNVKHTALGVQFISHMTQILPVPELCQRNDGTFRSGGASCAD